MSKSSRINGFDAMRTIAMWLGVVLHAIIAYKLTPEPGWPHDPAADSALLDWTYDIIHAFRMPLFFMVAGFFTRMVLLKSGARYFVRQRYRRIVLPFVIGVVLIVPLTLLPFHFNKYFYLRSLSLEEARRAAGAELLHWNGLAHLWFLYYLIIFYAMGVGIFLILKKRNLFFDHRHKSHFDEIGPLAILSFAMLLGTVLMLFNAFIPPVYTGIKPNLFYVLYYGLFFFGGWLAQVNPTGVQSLSRWGWTYLAGGIGLSFYMMEKSSDGAPVYQFYLSAIQSVFLVAGTTGIFMKYFHRESALWRYLSDSAYWVYLVHMGIVAAMQVALHDLQWNPWAKLTLILVVAFGLSLLSYHLLVRYTLIGVFLHGKRENPRKNVGFSEQILGNTCKHK